MNQVGNQTNKNSNTCTCEESYQTKNLQKVAKIIKKSL